MRTLLTRIAVAALCAMPALQAAAAEKFPSRPIRLIIPTGAGGVTDILGRTIAPKLSESLGQQVVIDNRPGASGIIGSHIVAKSAPDGYTLMMVYPSHVVNQSLFPDIPYDTARAFAPITMVSAVAPVFIVGAQSPSRSVAEFIALARAKPGQMNHGAVGAGSMGALAADLFASMAGIKFTPIAYKGSPQALTALVSGEIDFYLIGSVGTVVPQVKAGRIRALGVGAKQRIAPLPDVPPIADTLPGYEARGWNGILAPAGTPRAVIELLNRELVKIIRSRDRDRQHTSGIRRRDPRRHCEVGEDHQGLRISHEIARIKNFNKNNELYRLIGLQAVLRNR
jgi:tripartite-type tricarboxylate transporter receptor subunit TctC